MDLPTAHFYKKFLHLCGRFNQIVTQRVSGFQIDKGVGNYIIVLTQPLFFNQFITGFWIDAFKTYLLGQC